MFEKLNQDNGRNEIINLFRDYLIPELKKMILSSQERFKFQHTKLKQDIPKYTFIFLQNKKDDMTG